MLYLISNILKIKESYHDLNEHFRKMKSNNITRIESLILQQVQQTKNYGTAASELAKFWKKEAEKQVKLATCTQTLRKEKLVLKKRFQKTRKKLNGLQFYTALLQKRIDCLHTQHIFEMTSCKQNQEDAFHRIESLHLSHQETERQIINITIERDMWRHRMKKQNNHLLRKEHEIALISSTSSSSSLELLTGLIAIDVGYGVREFLHPHTGFNFLLRPMTNIYEKFSRDTTEYLDDEKGLTEYQPLQFGTLDGVLPVDFKEGLILDRMSIHQLFSRLLMLITNASCTKLST